MRNYSKGKQPSVLILADFSDGSWHAASFAMQYLYQNESPLSILQTYQSPNYGRFMMRGITAQLKEITKYELKRLKSKLLVNYRIDRQKVNTLSIEGELKEVLHNNPLIGDPCNIVLGTYSSFADSCYMQNMCLKNIVDSADKPVFILPGEFNGKPNKKLLYVGSINKKPSRQLVNHVIRICKEPQSELDMLFVLDKGVSMISDENRLFFHENFKEIDFKINQVFNASKCKGIIKYLKDKNRDLIIIENN